MPSDPVAECLAFRKNSMILSSDGMETLVKSIFSVNRLERAPASLASLEYQRILSPNILPMRQPFQSVMSPAIHSVEQLREALIFGQRVIRASAIG